VGAVPVFVDVEDESFQMDASKIEGAVTDRTKAIIPVHLYGQSPDMRAISALADKLNLAIIEDACQAHGSLYDGKKIGSLGNTACFSFYPSKVLGALGEAGAVVTDSRAKADYMKSLRNHGQMNKDNHEAIGYNYRMDQFQGAFLRIKLSKLDQWIVKRRAHAALYSKLLAHLEPNVRISKPPPYSISNYYVFVIRVIHRNKLASYLKGKGIDTQIHYPIPIHVQKAYEYLGYKRGSFPLAEAHAGEILSLPMYPGLTHEQINYIAEHVRRFYE
jgi:dTDP-4-amino-4,6-dideoxygalactose transaminase